MVDCERDLDDFHRWRKDTKPREAANLFYGPRIFANEPAMQQDYERVCRRANIVLVDYVGALNYRLDNMVKGYTAK